MKFNKNIIISISLVVVTLVVLISVGLYFYFKSHSSKKNIDMLEFKKQVMTISRAFEAKMSDDTFTQTDGVKMLADYTALIADILRRLKPSESIDTKLINELMKKMTNVNELRNATFKTDYSLLNTQLVKYLTSMKIMVEG